MSRFEIEVQAEVLGYNKQWAWLRIPINEGRSHVALTMPRAFLPHGMATAHWVVLAYDPESLHHDGTHYVVNGEIKEMLSAKGTVDAPIGST